MQSKNIYELLEQFQSDGFSLDSLAAITNVPASDCRTWYAADPTLDK